MIAVVVLSAGERLSAGAIYRSADWMIRGDDPGARGIRVVTDVTEAIGIMSTSVGGAIVLVMRFSCVVRDERRDRRRNHGRSQSPQ